MFEFAYVSVSLWISYGCYESVSKFGFLLTCLSLFLFMSVVFYFIPFVFESLENLAYVEHDGQNLTISYYWLPEITDKDSFCVVEHLTPLKFNISGKCFSGPVQHTNLALINCPNSRQVVSLEGLDRCFSSEVGFLCPKNVLKSVSSLQWLGFAWNPNLKLSFPRNHELAPDCGHIHRLIHLGGRYFLSTASGTLTLSSGELAVSPKRNACGLSLP